MLHLCAKKQRFPKGNNMDLIPNSIKPKVRYFIKEDQISLMICNHGCFQRKIPESSENVNKDQFLKDIKQAIDLSLPKKQAVDNTCEKRKNLIEKLKEFDSKFNYKNYIESTIFDRVLCSYPVDGEFNKIFKEKYLIQHIQNK